MAYSFACFISYKRPPRLQTPANVLARPQPKHLWLQFAEAFENQLRTFLNLQIPVFLDEHLQPGTDYPREFARNLCKSVCMVALVVPEYFESRWCLAEWEAMKSLEAGRLGPGKVGLIIPVICVGDRTSVEPFFGNRQGFDLAGIVSPARQLNSVRNRAKIQSIADIINRFSRTLTGPTLDCDAYTLKMGPDDVGADEIVPQIAEPSPFG